MQKQSSVKDEKGEKSGEEIYPVFSRLLDLLLKLTLRRQPISSSLRRACRESSDTDVSDVGDGETVWAGGFLVLSCEESRGGRGRGGGDFSSSMKRSKGVVLRC